MLTLVVQAALAAVFLIQSLITGLSISRRTPLPPGTTSTSSGGWFSSVWLGTTCMPFWQLTTSVPAAISDAVSAPSRSIDETANTSHGPVKSSSSAPSKISSP